MSNKKSKDTDNGIISKHSTKVVLSSLILAGLLITGVVTGFTVIAAENSNIISTAINNQEIGGGEREANITASSAATTTNTVTTEAATIPNKQITLIAEDTEIEIANNTRVKTWTFNGTVPGPTLRFTEGDNVTIRFINKSPSENHTIHFHGNHEDKNDGVLPQIMPNQTYLYNITGEPAGALMYHCHAPPTSHHIRMGMYGALIIDPKDKPVLQPAKEFVMVMSEINDSYEQKYPITLDTDFYLINGYANQYMHNPLEINHNDTIRLYLINMGTTIPYPFHLHSTTFKAYPSGLLDNEPIHVQTIPIAPGDAAIVEAKWKYPGTYLFHSHGIQEERGNMGEIHVTNDKTPLIKSVSMFDDQYKLQKELQKPKPIIINDTQDNGSAPPTSIAISMRNYAFDPTTVNITVGTTVTWTNYDEDGHTVTSGTGGTDPERGKVFDSGSRTTEEYLKQGETFKVTFNSTGTFKYFCFPHPSFMKGQVVVR